MMSAMWIANILICMVKRLRIIRVMLNSEFLDSEGVFSDSLLQLVARGSAIITELQRLSKRVPEVLFSLHP